MEFLISVIFSVVTAILLSLLFFTSKMQKGESFSLAKLVKTAIVGLVLGVVAGFSGFHLTAENLEMYMAANVATITVADKALTTIMKRLGLMAKA